MPSPTGVERPSTEKPNDSSDARWRLVILLSLLVSGLFLTSGLGELPRPHVDAAAEPVALATDLALYEAVIDRVREGEDYYAAAGELLPKYGFPVSSPFNWRLPTSAWLFAKVPHNEWMQFLLIILSLLAWLWSGWVKWRTSGSVFATVALLFLLVGVLSWSMDGKAYLAQEPWTATLLLCSVAAQNSGGRGRYAAAALGTAALFLRELALPFCGVALLVQAWHRRWGVAVAWGVGMAAFTVFYMWHVHQILAVEVESNEPIGAGFAQWIRLGGLDFVLLTLRMNQWLFTAPAWLLWLFLVLSVWGLAVDLLDATLVGSVLAYLLIFAVAGRPENFYWGLLIAFQLPWGLANAFGAIRQLIHETGWLQ